jgi:polyferredoxin
VPVLCWAMAHGPGTSHCGEGTRTVALEVLPSKPAGAGKPKSRMGKWRAAVLIGVHVIMLAHLAQWLWSREYGSGRTMSPVEPSEAMYTLELGQINAGFVFFTLALLATFIFGRFFCGWGCHVVALQDLCSHIMTKVGVRPRPLRSRLLLLAPTLLALYMFVWPTFKRVVLLPVERFTFEKWGWMFPEWLIELPRVPHPGFRNAFVVKDYWHTFPSEWYVIVPFFLTVGFAAVYFLGSKGFCTYGCPYGGFFAPLDKVSVGRIVVNDQCEGCGHCTAVCTSNVQVAREVRDFGMVVDPGCMKCLDCVSACPNDALSFSFARPAVLAKPRTAEARAGLSKGPKWDLVWWQDILLLALVIALFIGFRQMFNKVPLLMAAGMALIGGFGAWKLSTLLTEPNVRLQSLQLKLRGRLRPWGYAFVLLCSGYLAWGAWGLTIQALQFRANMWDLKVLTPAEVVFSPAYKPSGEDHANAQRAIKLYTLADGRGYGGFGWNHAVPQNLRLAWLYAVAGDLALSEAYLRRGISIGEPASVQAVLQLGDILALRGKSRAEINDELLAITRAKPGLYPVEMSVAENLLASDAPGAVRMAEAVLNATKPVPDLHTRVRAAVLLARAGRPDGLGAIDAVIGAEEEPALNGLLLAADIMLQAGRAPRAQELTALAIKHHPKAALAHFHHARMLATGNDLNGALASLAAASKLEPRNPMYLSAQAEVLMALGRQGEAERLMKAARDAASPPGRR